MTATDERPTRPVPAGLTLARLVRQRGVPAGSPPAVTVLITVLLVAGAGLVATTAAIHLHLWLSGYRHIPRLGPLFLAQAVTGLVLAPVLAVGRHLVAVAAGSVFMVASAIGLVLSATVGFVGIHDGLNVPWAMTSLVVELAGAVLLAGGGVEVTRRLAAPG